LPSGGGPLSPPTITQSILRPTTREHGPGAGLRQLAQATLCKILNQKEVIPA
jgi:hypothetical protein